MQENPQYAKFRSKGLPFAHQLTTLFKDVVATGQHAWAPSSGILPTGTDVDVDGYRPSLEDIPVEMDNNSGDSEDVNAGDNEDPTRINLSATQRNASQVNGEKGKRDSSSTKIRKAKDSAASRIANAVQVIAESYHSRNATDPVPSIGEAIAELHTLDDVVNDPEWHAQCCQLMMSKPAREVFVALRDFEDRRLNWLRLATRNP